MIFEKDVYIGHIRKILDDATKLEIGTIKKGILDFQLALRNINNHLKSPAKLGRQTTDQYEKIKALGSRPGILYGLC